LLNYFKQLSATNWGKKYLGLLVVEAKILLRQRGARDLGGLINNNNLGKER
jgi:ribosomal protein L27